MTGGAWAKKDRWVPHHNTCRGETCGATIRWARTEDGKVIPIDPDPVPGGPLVLTHLEPGAEVTRVRHLRRGEPDPDPSVPRYNPHHRTCPDADSFRKPKPKDPAQGVML